VKILPQWIREFIDVTVDDTRLASDLTQAGINVEGVSTASDGQTVWEVELTPNRVDAMNHYGIAREAGAIYDKELRPISPKLSAGPNDGGKPANDQRPKTNDAFPIEIADPTGCARYTARVLRGVKIAPSPKNIAARLEALESSAISNAVDASNYTLQEMGHPTHAFDLDLLAGGKIVVRRARKGETLKTLDGVDRKLDPDDLVIADATKPVALAGVMGGFDSMITERTRNILIESAWFDPASVRRTARRHGMHTDASHRFERGADYGATPLACDRVAELILASAGGQLEGAMIDAVARRVEPPVIKLRRSEVLRHLGLQLPDVEITRILRRLGFTTGPTGIGSGTTAANAPTAGSGGIAAAIVEDVTSFSVIPPSWRLDCTAEIDLIEELARIHGYNNFPNTLPSFAGAVRELPTEQKDARVRATMLALGYNEAISLNFIAKADAEAFSGSKPVELANPVSEEAGVMRTSLVPGMLSMLAWNLNRGVNTARLFERGHIFASTGDGVEEHDELCIGATGDVDPATVHRKARPYGFFDLKGDVEQLLDQFQCGAVDFDAANVPSYYHPGRSARAVVDGATVARFGELHPDIAAARKLRQPAYVAEIALNRLYERPLRQPRYTPIPRFPAVERDFSFVFDHAVTFERIQNTVDALKISTLRGFGAAEIFRGGSVPQGKYSVLLRATFQSPERTLRDDEVALWSTQIIKALEALGGSLRA
jgi:phenylalanyl-tRNA synthetase beta chain